MFYLVGLFLPFYLDSTKVCFFLMAKKSSNNLRFELFFVLVFIIGILLFAMRNCSAHYADQLPEEEPAEQPVEDTVVTAPASPAVPQPAATTPTTTARTIREKVTPLYVTIDSFKLRTNPTLNADVMRRLLLGEEVTYLNEYTQYTQKITLNGVLANEPWVKIRTSDGLVGWVYGAGVHFYPRRFGD